ncbi:MAG: restriction endonuclease subunit S [Ignavibacteriales bacterium]|nr:restriction endonuclease subunit S [Ignavibacteriales bacterium]
MSAKNFANLPIPLPPLPEQKKIVEKIEELFSGLDSGVASLKKAKELVRLYRQSVLASAFSGKLTSDKTPKVDGGINNKQLIIKNEKAKNNSSLLILNSSLPTGWKWVKLGEVCIKIGDVDHKMPKPVENGKYPYLSTKDFTDDLKIDFKKAKLISEEDFNLLSKKIKPQKGDIIFPRYGTIGKNVLVDCDKEFLVSYSCAVIKPNTEKIVTKYLYHYSLSPLIQKEIKKYTVQTTQANVGIESIKNFVVPLPSIIQQAKIVEEIESRFAGSEALEKTIDENLAKSETLRQSILKKAFEGHLI